MGKFGALFAAILLGLLGSIVFLNQGQTTQTKVNINLTPASVKTLNNTEQIKTPAQTIAPTAIITSMPEKANSATIQTAKGNITIDLYPDEAPNTVANFVNKAKNGFYNSLTFHRVEDWVIQGGDPMGNGTGGGSIPVEFNSKPFVKGAVGIASRGDGQTQNDSQFFIVKNDSEFLNGQYTNIGIVTNGMDVVDKIAIGDKILKITAN